MMDFGHFWLAIGLIKLYKLVLFLERVSPGSMAFSVFLHLAVCRCIWLYISLSVALFLFSVYPCMLLYVCLCLLPYASFLLSMSVSVCLFLSLSLLISSCHHSTLQKTPHCAIYINPGVGGGLANNQNFGLGAGGVGRGGVGEGGRKRVVKC